MLPTPELLLQRVQALMPDLNIEQVEMHEEGMVNNVLIVNRALVFRFAKTGAGAKILAGEMNILDLVRPRVGLAVPTPFMRLPDCVAYPFLAGQPLTREALFSLDPAAQSQIARQLGKFLYGLHTTPLTGLDWELPRTLAPVTRERWLDIRRRATQTVYPLLLKHQIAWAERLFDSVLADPSGFDYTPVLVHGDLAPYHILFAGDTLTAVIDFGVAGIGDPALDLGSLIGIYGERFARQIAPQYPGFDTLLPRARFYAQSIEIQWVLLGLETGETFWFTAHLASARDIEP